MIKKGLRPSILALCIAQTIGWAQPGNLFNITATGSDLAQPVSYSLCLSVRGPSALSCQTFTTQKSNLSIRTHVPNHTYPYAGIKINTPGYTYSPQNPSASPGYVLLGSISDTQAATGTLFSEFSISESHLALSITGLTLNASPSGQPRTLTITNTSDVTENGLTIEYPTWPTGTSATSTCGSTLTPASSCTITITPGPNPTSACSTTGIAPTPGMINVRAAAGEVLASSSVVVLNYGCIYQGGYIFSMLETSNTQQSIGGSVVAETDQAPRYSFGTVWSSNGSGTTSPSYDVIPGIAQSSGGASIPTYSSAQTHFNTQYNNTGTYPFPSSGSFATCHGNVDGACNSSNILMLYNTYITNYGSTNNLAPGPTNPTYYAAGLCTATISDYTDWYLPAICQMSITPGSSGSIGCSGSTQNINDQLHALIGQNPVGDEINSSCTYGAYGAHCLTGYYWSSTESTTAGSDPAQNAWDVNFASSSSPQSFFTKNTLNGVRCVRDLST